MKKYQLACGDELHYYKKSLVLYFRGPRKVLSTGLNHGGCRTDLQAVFNNDGNPGPGIQFNLRADTYREHLDIIAEEDMGLDPEKCTGLCTAASMDNVSIQAMEHENFTVTAIVTGGIQGNGGRIGDTAVHSEKPGTINIILHIDANLPDGTLVKALASCTEAKVAAIQELLAPSRYSRGLATGSGTDGVIVVCNTSYKQRLTDAGHHSKLGEYIGKTVKKAVKEALFLQTELGPAFQHNIIRRMDRFGVTEDKLWSAYREKMEAEKRECTPRFAFENRLDGIKTGEQLVTCTSLYAHLMDQLDWGLLQPQEAWRVGSRLLEMAGMADFSQEKIPKDSAVPWMIQKYIAGLLPLLE
ncbi:MAG: adenosylcobinamide amidohydrolase [Lachnospiraceae bacterium]|nr:adenosylcobinamide amidohydrolase [Lachnospiraceae bacterium]